MSNILFMRHGEHIGDGASCELYSGLTATGCDEMRFLSGVVKGHSVKRAYSVGNERSMGSSALALMPDTSNLSIKEAVYKLSREDLLRADEDLSYKEHNDPEFQLELDSAFFSGNCLRFYVERSDRYIGRNDNGTPVSTYSGLAAITADKITSYNDSLVCAREFFYPSLRAKLTDIRLGKRQLDRYVDYYCSEVEWNPDARVQVQSIERKGLYYRLNDDYGQLEFSISDILKIKRGSRLDVKNNR